MTGSTISLDSLSSPSPSPSPPPEAILQPEPNNVGLDTASELSELTEEEESDKRRNPPKKSKKSSSSDEGDSSSRYRKTRKNNSIVPGPMWNWVEPKPSSKVVEEEEEEEVTEPPRAMEEEEEDEEMGEDGEEEPGAPNNGSNEDDPNEDAAPTNGADDDDYVSGNEDRESTRPRPRALKQRRLNGTSTKTIAHDASVDPEQPGPSHENPDDGEDEASDIDAGQADAGSDNDTQSDEEDDDAGMEDGTPLATGEGVTSGLATELSSKAISSALLQAVVDVTAPAVEDIAPLNAAAAASSIIGATSVINPPSTSPSTPNSSRSASPSSSRSASPAPDEDADEVAEDAKPAKGTTGTANSGPLNTMDVDAPEPSAVDDQENDADVDEQDMEVESDLQPAHRAEALDALARIELRFALLRERVYVEKMEALAWEESLISEDVHPELIHLQNELTNRRNKRLQLAERKREFEIENVRKRRRADESAVWSWWKFSRDELQTDMISEVNRKRRRMERERRAFERPQPVRRIPVLPHELPPTPSIRKVIKAYSIDRSRRGTEKLTQTQTVQQKLSYPELSALEITDVAHDLEYLYQARLERERGRGGIPSFAFDQNRHLQTNAGPAPGTAQQIAPVAYEAYDPNPPSNGAFGPGGNALHRAGPFPGQQHSVPFLPNDAHPVVGPPSGSYPGSKNLPIQPPYQQLQTIGGHHPPQHGYSQGPPPPFPPQDMAIGGAPGGQMLPHPGYPSGGPQHPLRRSPSPVNMNGATGYGSTKSMWDGQGPAMNGPYQHGKVDWDDSRDRRDREKREKERDAMEAERHRESQHLHQPPSTASHRHAQPPHHHAHSTQASHRHSNGAHHHHHRHVHVHHHHHQPTSSAPSGRLTPPPAQSGPRSPRRDYDPGRSHAQHPTEVLALSKPGVSHPHNHWKGEEPPPHHQTHEYRDVRNVNSGRPGMSHVDDHDRPAPLPFAMSSVNHHPQSGNGTSSPHGTWDERQRGPPPFANPDDRGAPPRSPPHRYASGPGVPSNRERGHPLPTSRQDTRGLSPPRSSHRDSRSHGPPASPGGNSASYSNSQRSPTRYGPSGISSHREPHGSAHPNRSPPVSLKMGRPPSPSNKLLLGSSLPPPVPSTSYSPRLSGPGRTVTPTGRGPLEDGPGMKNPPLSGSSSYPGGNNPRTSSPFGSYPPSNSHPSLTSSGGPRSLLGSYPGSGSSTDRDRDWPRDKERERMAQEREWAERDRERERLSPPPHLGPPSSLSSSKMSLPQMVEGR